MLITGRTEDMKRILNIIVNLIILSAVIAVILGGILFYRGYSLYKDKIEYKSVSAVAGEIRSDPNYVPISELPDFYLKAVISVEDKSFYKHKGISVKGIARALFYNLKNGSADQGGSTITQQLAKNELFTQEKTLKRKVAEIFAAFEFEKELSKDEILELYVNSICFGNGCFGIGSAAKGIYGKEPLELTEWECAVLAGMPKSPSYYSSNPDAAEKRGKDVLMEMLRQGEITDEEFKKYIYDLDTKH